LSDRNVESRRPSAVGKHPSISTEETPPAAARPPLIVVACREPEISRGILRDLRREFGVHGFNTVCAGSPDAAWELVASADREGTDLAMVLAEQAAEDPGLRE
jgi:hypothetical protein